MPLAREYIPLSAKPASTPAPLSTTREEGLDCSGAILSKHAGSYFNPVIETLVREYLEARANCPALGVVRTVDQSLNARLNDCPGAHATGLDRNIKRRVAEPIIPEGAGRFAQGDDFGVRCGIAVVNGAVAGTGNDGAIMHQKRADGHFAGGRRSARFLECLLHEFNVGIHLEPENSTLTREYFCTEAT